jgi:peptidoglycan/xylan/chitin deacetylase (PgdA/CDA1 family)
VPAAAFAAVLADGIFRPSSATLYPTLCHGSRQRPQVALTFDDGPDPEVTPRVLDALANFGARATFFVIGRHLEKNPALGENMLWAGHELGNHSWQHSYLQNFFSATRHAADIERCSQLIRSLSHSDIEPLYRPPVGLKSPELARAAHARQLTIVAWSVHARDTFKHDPQVIASRVLSHIRPGDIVLMHDGHERDHHHRPALIAALPLILQGLRERGLQSVPVRELLRESPG